MGNHVILFPLWLIVESHGVNPCNHQSVIAERGPRKGVPDFQHYRGVEGRARSPGIRLGRRFSRSSLNLHQNKPPKWLDHFLGHLGVLGQATGTLDHKTHHGPDSREATTFPHIVFSVTLYGGYIQMALFSGLPSWSPEIVPELSWVESWDFGSS